MWKGSIEYLSNKPQVMRKQISFNDVGLTHEYILKYNKYSFSCLVCSTRHAREYKMWPL